MSINVLEFYKIITIGRVKKAINLFYVSKKCAKKLPFFKGKL